MRSPTHEWSEKREGTQPDGAMELGEGSAKKDEKGPGMCIPSHWAKKKGHQSSCSEVVSTLNILSLSHRRDS